uniref:Uncharacterized protein n=1 Tax=Anguilla anguilla TaxID=7936 RepID=A0A0E9VUF5_ANGAN
MFALLWLGGAMPHTYTGPKVWHFSGFPTEMTTMTTDSQSLRTLTSVLSDLMYTLRIHIELHTAT